MKKFWSQYLLVYIMWFIFILLGVLFIIISRNGLISLMSQYHPTKVGDALQWTHMSQLIDRAYFIVTGFILLIVLIVIEEYFKRGARNGKLLQYLLRTFGIEVLFLFGANILIAYVAGFSLLVLITLIAELALAGALIWLGFRKPRIAAKAG